MLKDRSIVRMDVGYSYENTQKIVRPMMIVTDVLSAEGSGIDPILEIPTLTIKQTQRVVAAAEIVAKKLYMVPLDAAVRNTGRKVYVSKEFQARNTSNIDEENAPSESTSLLHCTWEIGFL